MSKNTLTGTPALGETTWAAESAMAKAARLRKRAFQTAEHQAKTNIDVHTRAVFSNIAQDLKDAEEA